MTECSNNTNYSRHKLLICTAVKSSSSILHSQKNTNVHTHFTGGQDNGKCDSYYDLLYAGGTSTGGIIVRGELDL